MLIPLSLFLYSIDFNSADFDEFWFNSDKAITKALDSEYSDLEVCL